MDESDPDWDSKLDFEQFSTFIRAREEGSFTEEELRKRFDIFDVNEKQQIDMHEYLQWSLRDALQRSATRLIDVFKMWDEDRSGTVDKKEFFKAIRAVGFKIDKEDSDYVFDSLDEDKSGSLEYAELSHKLASQGASLTKRNLKRQPTQAYHGRDAKVTRKNMNVNYIVAHAAALPESVQLVPGNGVTVQEQLRDLLRTNRVTLIDLFREWDDNGDGGLDKKEFRAGVQGLGYIVPRQEIDDVFDWINGDGNGFVEFEELKKALTDKALKEAAEAADAKARAEGKELPSVLRKQMESAAALAPAGSPRSLPPIDTEMVKKQLRRSSFLAMNNIKVLEMFREWDEDGNQALDKSELRRAVKVLGYYAPADVCDALFDSIDESGDGLIDFDEMKRALNQFLKGRLPSPKRSRQAAQASSPRLPSRASSIMANLESALRLLNSLPRAEDPGELVVEATGLHTHTVIMLQPESSTAEGVYGRLSRRFIPAAENCKFVFPRVPVREAGGSFWFLPPRTKTGELPGMHFFVQPGYESEEATYEARAQLEAQSMRLHAILDREAALLKGDTSRIVLGGTAQGGSVALHSMLSYRAQLAGMLCLRCAVLERFTTDALLDQGRSQQTTPLFVFAGGRDAVCPLEHQHESFIRLSERGFSIEWHIEPGLGHTAESLNEQRYVAYWSSVALQARSSKPLSTATVDALRSNLVVKKAPAQASLVWSIAPRAYTARPNTMIDTTKFAPARPGSAGASPEREGGSSASPPRKALSARELPHTHSGNPGRPVVHAPAYTPHSPGGHHGSGRSSQKSKMHPPPAGFGTARHAASASPTREMHQPDEMQRPSSQPSSPTDAPTREMTREMVRHVDVQLPPGSKTFIKGLKRAYDRGAYVPTVYMMPSGGNRMSSPRVSARVGVHPLHRQPDWRSWEMFL